MILFADSECPDQDALMRGVVWAFAARICQETRFCMAKPIWCWNYSRLRVFNETWTVLFMIKTALFRQALVMFSQTRLCSRHIVLSVLIRFTTIYFYNTDYICDSLFSYSHRNPSEKESLCPHPLRSRPLTIDSFSDGRHSNFDKICLKRKFIKSP